MSGIRRRLLSRSDQSPFFGADAVSGVDDGDPHSRVFAQTGDVFWALSGTGCTLPGKFLHYRHVPCSCSVRSIDNFTNASVFSEGRGWSEHGWIVESLVPAPQSQQHSASCGRRAATQGSLPGARPPAGFVPAKGSLVRNQVVHQMRQWREPAFCRVGCMYGLCEGLPGFVGASQLGRRVLA